jgi:arginine:ornithine antiporter/lysine permease
MSSVSSSVDTHASGATSGKLTLLPLIALVVGSMIGGGVFNLPSDMSKAASPGAIMIGWAISGFGMLMLAFVYQSLAVRKPKLNAGPYAYARAGFGDFVGFNSAWGYWLSAFLGNVAYAVAIFSALSYFIPAFEGGNNLLSIVCASVLLRGIHFLVLSGVKQAAFINVITTVAKLVPIMLFILLGVLAFNLDKMNFNFWGAAGADSPGLGPILEQVRSTMLVTLWVFIGIEGASVYSERAANRADVGRATVIGFLGALAIYVLVSLIATGIMTQAELAGQKVPSMAGVFEQIVGPWGAMLINIGLIVSVGGAFLAWTLLCAEVPYAAGKDGTFPSWFAKENANGSPVNSLWVTNGLIQLFLIVSLWSEEAYQFFYFIASVAILPPYVLSGAYAAKLAITGETYEREKGSQTLDLVVGALATIYGLWLVYAAGLDYLLMNAVLFAPGILVFWYARSEHGQSVFKGYEMLLAGLLLAAAAYAGYQMYTGALTPL